MKGRLRDSKQAMASAFWSARGRDTAFPSAIASDKSIWNVDIRRKESGVAATRTPRKGMADPRMRPRVPHVTLETRLAGPTALLRRALTDEPVGRCRQTPAHVPETRGLCRVMNSGEVISPMAR